MNKADLVDQSQNVNPFTERELRKSLHPFGHYASGRRRFSPEERSLWPSKRQDMPTRWVRVVEFGIIVGATILKTNPCLSSSAGRQNRITLSAGLRRDARP